MKKRKNFILFCVVGAIIILGCILILTREKDDDKIVFGLPGKTEGLTIVPTMQDDITSDSAWVGTFQLIWNDLVNEVVKKEVIFNPQELMVTNLNKQEYI